MIVSSQIPRAHVMPEPLPSPAIATRAETLEADHRPDFLVAPSEPETEASAWQTAKLLGWANLLPLERHSCLFLERRVRISARPVLL